MVVLFLVGCGQLVRVGSQEVTVVPTTYNETNLFLILLSRNGPVAADMVCHSLSDMLLFLERAFWCSRSDGMFLPSNFLLTLDSMDH